MDPPRSVCAALTLHALPVRCRMPAPNLTLSISRAIVSRSDSPNMINPAAAMSYGCRDVIGFVYRDDPATTFGRGGVARRKRSRDGWRMLNDDRAQILAAVDLVELIGQTVALKRRGRSYTGLCPFHQEKSP